MSAWIQHIKKVQAETGMSYKDAMKEAKHSYHKGSASKTRPKHEDFMAHKGTKSRTKPHHMDYEGEGLGEHVARAVGHTAMYVGKKLGIRRKDLMGLAGLHRGGAVGDIELPPSNIPTYGNTNLGRMRIPQASVRGVVNTSGQRHIGGAIIQQESNQGYLGELYNGRNLGANGVVRL
jgi:hypothetical protein